MVYFLYTLFFVSCVALIASVLLQPGKTDAGALFTSNISSTAFQPRGSQTILSKITIIAATTFMLSALLLAMPALTGNISVLTTNPDAPTEEVPVVAPDANANVDVNSNANAAVETNSNTSDIQTNTNTATNSNTTTNTNTTGK
ncbi:MAG: preprotein translocase subunit SecG [Acidobacteriota bacterium]